MSAHIARLSQTSPGTFGIYAWNGQETSVPFDAAGWMEKWDLSAIQAVDSIYHFIKAAGCPGKDMEPIFPEKPECVDLFRDDDAGEYRVFDRVGNLPRMRVIADWEQVVRTGFEEGPDGFSIPVTASTTDPDKIREASLECASSMLLTSVCGPAYPFSEKEIFIGRTASPT